MESLPVCSSGRHRKSILYGRQAEASARRFSICSVTSFLSLVPCKTWVLDWTPIGASGKVQCAGLRYSCSSRRTRALISRNPQKSQMLQHSVEPQNSGLRGQRGENPRNPVASWSSQNSELQVPESLKRKKVGINWGRKLTPTSALHRHLHK